MRSSPSQAGSLFLHLSTSPVTLPVCVGGRGPSPRTRPDGAGKDEREHERLTDGVLAGGDRSAGLGSPGEGRGSGGQRRAGRRGGHHPKGRLCFFRVRTQDTALQEQERPRLRQLRSGVSDSRSVVSGSLQPRGLHSAWDSPGQKAGVGSLSLLNGIFPTQGSNPGLPH